MENRSNSRIRRKANQSGFLDDSNLDSVEPYSTLGEEDPKAKQKEVLKVYMENQLDLNESEMEYYEGVIEDLAAQLEKMREEKDDLQSTTGSLEEKFQMLESRNMDLLEEQRQEFEDKKLFYVTKINELQKQVKVADEVYLSNNSGIDSL